MSINHIILKKSPLGVPIRDTIMQCHLGFVAGVLCGHSDVTPVTQKSSTFCIIYSSSIMLPIIHEAMSCQRCVLSTSISYKHEYVVKYHDSILFPNVLGASYKCKIIYFATNILSNFKLSVYVTHVAIMTSETINMSITTLI